jgi:hypothetical protein
MSATSACRKSLATALRRRWVRLFCARPPGPGREGFDSVRDSRNKAVVRELPPDGGHGPSNPQTIWDFRRFCEGTA